VTRWMLAKAGLLSMLVTTARGEAAGAEVALREEILGSREAAAAVLRARRLDPRFARLKRFDREAAVAAYEQAMVLQPQAKINADLANRVAQLYAFSKSPDRAKAVAWWRRCIAQTAPDQLLWARAHMGIGCATFLAGRPKEAVEAFSAILELDPDRVEWPDWRVRPDPRLPSGRRILGEEMARIRKEAAAIKIKAVEKIHYVLVRHDGAAAVSAMIDVAKQHAGSPVAARASELARQSIRDSRPSLYRYRDLDWADLEATDKQKAPSSERHVARGPLTETQAAGLARPASRTPPQTPGPLGTPVRPLERADDGWSWGILSTVLVAAVLVAAAFTLTLALRGRHAR